MTSSELRRTDALPQSSEQRAQMGERFDHPLRPLAKLIARDLAAKRLTKKSKVALVKEHPPSR